MRIEIPRGVRQVPAHVRLHGEAFFAHLLAERAQSRNRIDARVVPLLPLQTAHLRNQRLGAAHLHAVYYVRNLHTGCLNLRSAGQAVLLFLRLIDSYACCESVHQVQNSDHDVHHQHQRERQPPA